MSLLALCRLCFSMHCQARISRLFPYTTLFRSLDFEGSKNRLGLTAVAEVKFFGLVPVTGTVDADGSLKYIPELGEFQFTDRSEEHTSELQSLRHLVCRLLLEKKKILQAADPSP